MNLKSLVKDTAIYGLSSIVGRFLNYLLVPIYTYHISAASGGYGIVSNLYAYSALLLALLTFGMETTLFRFASKEGEDPKMVYSNALRLVGGVVLVFVALVVAFIHPISVAMGYSAHPEYIIVVAIIAAMDAFQAIMFVRLRQQHRPMKFMALKMLFIGLNVLLTLFVFLVMPKVEALAPVYDRFDGGVGLIFFINLLCTTLVNFGFIPEFKGLFYGFDKALAKRMLSYTWPILLLSVVGILNQVADKILLPKLMPGSDGLVQLGIYGACVKIAMIMALLTQAFRYAYEPIVFSGSSKKDSVSTLADGMKYFIIFTLMAFLAVMFYMPIVKHFIAPDYWEGLAVVPIVMMAEIFMGIYSNLSFWYKLTDQTWWGAIISAISVAAMIAINVILVPRIGYWACAWGGFAGYGIAMTLSYFLGQKHYPVDYDLRTIFMFCVIAAVLYYFSIEFEAWVGSMWLSLAFNTALLASYCVFVWREIKPALKKSK